MYIYIYKSSLHLLNVHIFNDHPTQPALKLTASLSICNMSSFFRRARSANSTDTGGNVVPTTLPTETPGSVSAIAAMIQQGELRWEKDVQKCLGIHV